MFVTLYILLKEYGRSLYGTEGTRQF